MNQTASNVSKKENLEKWYQNAILYDEKDFEQVQRLQRICCDEYMQPAPLSPVKDGKELFQQVLNSPLSIKLELGIPLAYELVNATQERVLNYVNEAQEPSVLALFDQSKLEAFSRGSIFIPHYQSLIIPSSYSYPLYALCYPPKANAILFVRFQTK